MRFASFALRASLLTLAAASALPAMAQAAPAQTLTLERLFGSPDLNGPQLRSVKLSPDGSLVTLLRARADDRQRFDLWAIDTSTGAERMLVDSAKIGSGAELSEAEKMQRERARIGGTRGIVAYDWAPDGKSILVPIDGDIYLATLDGKVSRITDTPQGELNAVVSPKGRFASFVRDGNLFVHDLTSGGERAVTTGATETLHWGEAEFVAQEEMDRTAGYWWSPDDSRIVVARVDESPVGIVNRAAIGADGTHVYAQRYPAAGTPNAKVDLFLVNPDGSGMIPVRLGAAGNVYIARVDWSADGKALYVQREYRDQKELVLFRVDPATGNGVPVLHETSPTWINLSNNFHPLKDGSFLWWSEKSGHGHLYRVRGDKWTQLTEGDWEVRDIIGVDESANGGGGLVYFTGNRETPLEQQVYSVPIDHMAAPRQLTGSGWWNGAIMDKAATRMVVTRSNTDQPNQTYLSDTAGARLRWLSENAVSEAGHPYAPFMAQHAHTRFGTIKAADGADLYYRIQTPTMQPGKQYPVFMIHYGGPGAGRQVTNTWGSSGALNDYLVSQGWIVFAVDNRGTPDRGKAFEDHIYHAMGTVEVADQLRGVDWLKRQPFVDGTKIATYGWSYGGYMSVKLLEKSHGVFAAAVAGAPVTDWTLYDTHYTERYLGDPNARDSAYPASGDLVEATKITDPLLLIHGMSDDNVVFDNMTRLMTILQQNAVPFETMLYPGQTHRVAGPGVSVHLWKTILAFLDRHVKPDR